MSIHLLSDQTINKIAAGEVIENPSSVVKELVENALDAKGDVITIEIERGGFSLIRVSDNGSGMGQDDLLLCLERHATSKIQSAEDLIKVLTMGFRGEALASIGAVSKMKIFTAQEKKNHGYEISCHGGKLSSPIPTARSCGTTIEVRGLFYNVPARLKFQKSALSNQNAIRKLIARFSLAHPEKTFRFFAEGKEMMNLLPGKLGKRCSDILGDSFIKGGSEVNFSEKEAVLKGFIGSPMDAKSNRMGQYLFVNGRAVVSAQISQAIYEGYGTRLGANLHPTYVIHMTLPPEWVDVNVHPQKKEIRLREEGVIQEGVRRAILGAFKGEVRSIQTPKMEWSFEAPLKLQETFDEPSQNFSFDSEQEDLPIIGLFDSYLILHKTPLIHLPNEDGIFLVDLEGSTARILYERFLGKQMLPLQTLLFPITLEFSPHEKKQLSLHIEEIRKMGIDIRPFGETTFIIDALTSDIEEEKLQGLLESLAEIFDQNLVEKEREKKLALSASYSAKSQKKGWALIEAKQIVKQLLKTTSPYHCPKGKKTIIALNHDAIKKLFQKKSS
ncbi:MAG: DNA mismatch repair endonuclease MutL [Simkaniaceae bacterium]|nr:MAG: DNA mismatch repair endonuclease MutL [Simkaniaceae bacterium]